MSTLKVDTIDGGSTIDFPHGFNVGGLPLTVGYTSSSSAPASPSDGDFWYDSTNKVLYQYVNDGFQKIITKPAKFYPRNYKFVADQSVSVSSYDSTPRVFTIGKDNKTVVISGTSGDDLELARLATAKDMSTLPATPNSALGYGNNYDTLPTGAFWSPDGDYLFAVGQNTDDLDRWSCPTAFSLSGATNDQTNTTALASVNPSAVYFSPDGTKAFFTNTSENLYKATLSTAWDVSSSSLTIDTSNYHNFSNGQSINRGENVAHYGGLWFSDDGYQCVIGTSRTLGSSLHWGQMTTAWDISTLTFDP